MLDCVTEIPLPGRLLAPPKSPTHGSTAAQTLPSFVAGPENRMVAGAIGELLLLTPRSTDSPATTPFAPALLVLFGSSGTGKSHLAQGLVRHWQAQLGEPSAVYTTAADFRHLLNDAIKHQAELGFRAEFRNPQLLAIDDLQHLPADHHALQELRYTLDDYEDRGAIVVVTSNQPINSLPNLPPDIRSRLAGGLTLQLAPPGDTARLHIIRHAAQALGQPISTEACNRLAHGVAGSANNLFSALFELYNTANNHRGNDIQRTDRLLAAHTARRPTLRNIIAVVARRQNIPQARLKSSSRRQSIVFARGLIIYLAREIAAASYDEIGRALGGRDHTTIIHSYRKIAAERECDPQTQLALENLQRILLSR